jgi:quercetin dioxygenase-like cupin family protein
MLDSLTRRTILQTLVAGLALPAAGGAADAAQVPTSVVASSGGKLDAQPFGDLRVFLEGPTEQLKGLTVGNLALKPGQTPHPPHRHPEEEILIITAGNGEIFLEGKTTKVASGDMMYAESNRLHGITASTDAPMTFYYFKWLGK